MGPCPKIKLLNRRNCILPSIIFAIAALPLVVPVVEVFVIQRSLVLDGAGPFWEAWG